ncbi:peptide deformylase [candidate division KSB1 bacterium]|nr:peptide deformylase [candidate division KSB1 bacterium]
MAKTYELKIYPDAVLRQKADVVDTFDDQIENLVTAMQEIMYRHQGIGLAAPQVGVTKRIFIADIGEGLLTVINPNIAQQEGHDNLIEGCLSLPNVAVDIQRHQQISLLGVDLKGKKIEVELKGLLARVAQHEIDHLNGRLIIDDENTSQKDRSV